ncbi:hypothetical protein [Geomesophilobacter sediminis]|uniref:Uncharacterized protein n=1 Tax=Geomesophilobacter sediminis TaxID=2798584 RepID=A0A8J7JD58_9BACT|nr:hypothetical protein [Geomesophilobacter sediminis]MBJ6725271.1 hypothetical protein [Geomesophilobacter sediminis]
MLAGVRGTVVTAFLLLIVDAVLVNTVFMAGIVLLVGIPVLLVKLVLYRKERERRRLLLKRAAVWGAMVVLSIAALIGNDSLAVRRAEKVIAACEAFRGKTGAYPEKLSQLVPGYLPKIPLAKPFVTVGDKFQYHADPADHCLSYTTVPPYGRMCYHLEKRHWEALND